MGDISIIARRLAPERVQYGWGGNSGYFTQVGYRLIEWYTKPEDVEYLFGLGQTCLIGKKGSENGGCSVIFTHHLTGESFWLGNTEREIFSKIAFIDYGYFYDLDHKWYYIIPGPFRIKIPFELVDYYIDAGGDEFDYRNLIEHAVAEYIFHGYKDNNPEFAELLSQEYDDIDREVDHILNSTDPIDVIFEKYKKIFKFFDDWVLITADKTGKEMGGILMRKKEEQHLETFLWS